MKKNTAIYIFITALLLFGCNIQRRSSSIKLLENVGPYIYYYEAIQNRLYGNVNKAIENLQKSILLDNNKSASYYELALCYSSIQKYQEAIESLEKAIEIEPDNIYYRNFLAMLFINTGDLEVALDQQKILVKSNPQNITYSLNLALLLSENKDFNEAKQILEEIKSNYGFIPKVSETLARLYFELGDFDKAKEEVNLLSDFMPENTLYLLYQADIFFKEGKDSLGFQKIYNAIDLDSISPFPLIELYNRQAEFGRIQESLKTLNIIFSNTNVTEIEKVQLFYPILFEQYYYTILPQKVDSLIFELNSKYPNSIPVSEISFEHFIRRRNFEEARKSLLQLVKIDRNNNQRWDKLISLEFALDNYEAVIKLSLKAIELFPTSHNFYILTAVAYQQINDIPKAIDVLKEGTNKVKDNYGQSDIFGTLGDYQYMTGDINSAFLSYKQSIKLNENNARILNNYSYYLSLRKEKLKTALEMSSKAVDLEPNNSTYIDTKGWVLFQMGRFQEARDVLRNAIAKSGSTSAVINEHYGDALFKTGNIDNAYIYWLKAKEIGGGSEKLEEKIQTKKWVP